MSQLVQVVRQPSFSSDSAEHLTYGFRHVWPSVVDVGREDERIAG